MLVVIFIFLLKLLFFNKLKILIEGFEKLDIIEELFFKNCLFIIFIKFYYYCILCLFEYLIFGVKKKKRKK